MFYNYIIISFKIIMSKKIRKFSLSCKYKINKSNTKISARYWIICNIIILYVESNPLSSNIRVLIKIYNICPILYVLQIISWINTIKSRFILIIFLYLKIWYMYINLFTDSIYSFTFSALFTPWPIKIFSNKLLTNVPKKILRNPPFCSFT